MINSICFSQTNACSKSYLKISKHFKQALLVSTAHNCFLESMQQKLFQNQSTEYCLYKLMLILSLMYSVSKSNAITKENIKVILKMLLTASWKVAIWFYLFIIICGLLEASKEKSSCSTTLSYKTIDVYIVRDIFEMYICEFLFMSK